MSDTSTREDPNPTPIDCAGAICVSGERVLLIRRGQPPREGEWSIPGGRIEAGETAPAAALRELHEETGVTATLHAFVETVDAVFEGATYRLQDYVLIWQAGRPVASDDASDARWFTLEDARTLGMWPKTLEVVERAVAMARQPADPALILAP